MRFAHLTTFFGATSFGGDAVYVDRLARSLLERGHDVDVFHCPASFRLLAGRKTAARPYVPPPALGLHEIPCPGGPLTPAWTHQTGRMGPRGRWLERRLREGEYDVVHLHNVSLIGAGGLIELAGSLPCVAVMTAHDHWLTCPLSTRFDRVSGTCEQTCAGVRCSLRGARPPQLWRRRGRTVACTQSLDAVIAPTHHLARLLRSQGIDARVLPHFLDEDWPGGRSGVERPRCPRPYVAAAGRLVEEKGFAQLVDLLRALGGVDLVIAGEGPQLASLREAAARVPGVHFAGSLSAPSLAELFAGARAVVCPSLWWEPFGLVALEAAAVGTPVIARRVGGLTEVVEALGGYVCRDDGELAEAIRTLAASRSASEALGRQARTALRTSFTPEAHLAEYGRILGTSAL